MKKTFKYCRTHKEDEAYMQQMCARGWAALGLTEGLWRFEACRPNEYCYRICYLRGKTGAQVEALKKQYADRGIELVSRYSFWAICRSREPFELYTPEEERAICRKIYAPMPLGAAASLLLCAGSIFLAGKISPWFWALAALSGIYGAMCTWLGLGYRDLLRKL